MAWKKVKLEKICDISSGGTPSRKENSYYNGQIPWLKISDLNVRGKFVYDSEEKITNRGLNAIRDKIFEKGTLMFAMYGSIGKTAFAGVNLSCNQAILGISSKDNNRTNLDYINYWLKSKKFFLSKLANGVAQKNLSATIIKELEIPLPPIEIQIKIAKALDKAQELIDNRKLQLEKYDELIQSTFIDMFGDPITNPKNWEIKRLKEISTKILSGNTPKGGSNIYTKKGIPFFRSQNIWRNKIKYEDIVYIDEAIHESMQKSSLKNRDILITKTGRINTENSSLGRAAMFLGEDNKGNINGHVYLVRLKKCMADKFVLYIITTDKYREYIRSICVGAIDKRQINKNHLEEFPIINPPIELQSKFASIVEKIEYEKKICEESLKRLEENFNSIIDKAFKGELF